jgi:hypothetical protein
MSDTTEKELEHVSYGARIKDGYTYTEDFKTLNKGETLVTTKPMYGVQVSVGELLIAGSTTITADNQFKALTLPAGTSILALKGSNFLLKLVSA